MSEQLHILDASVWGSTILSPSFFGCKCLDASVDLTSLDSLDKETWVGISNQHGPLDEQDAAYIGELLKSVQMVTDVMEALVKRVLLAESETAIEKEKMTFGQEEIRSKDSLLGLRTGS